MIPPLCSETAVFSAEERVKSSALDILVFMRYNNCYSKVLEEQLFEFLFNLSTIQK